jgi:hypothetical protein
MQTYYAPSPWLAAGMAHVSTAVTVNMQKAITKPLPTSVAQAVKYLLTAMGTPATPVEGRVLPDDTAGGGDKLRIILDPAKCAGFTWQRLVHVVVHEAAHVKSQDMDCTRRHANAISDLSVALMETIAAEPTAYATARAAFSAWQQAQ